MSETLFTAEQAAELLKLHVKTVLRHIREGRLPAARIGKSYRITRSALDAFAGIVSGRADTDTPARTTCVVDLANLPVERAERLVILLQSAALTGDAETPRLHLETAFDPAAGVLKVVMLGSPGDVAGLLELLQLQLRGRT